MIAAALVVVGALAGVTVTSASAGGSASLQDVKKATARFHSVTQAEAEGYTVFADCFDDPTLGGMGQHYVNQSLLNDGGQVDPNKPEALVYEVRDGSLKLVAVEWIVNQADVTQAPDPLFEHGHFHPFATFYVMHAWIWRDNPSGMFEDYNPDVAACP
jgi:hypothetical protein